MSRRSPPPLSAGTLHLWSASLDGLLGDAEASRQLLAPDELDRASRFHFERDAARYIVGRGALRRLLASYTAINDPRDVQLKYGPYGKPALDSQVSRADELQFNLAHSGGFVLFGFARSVELGVDVERVHDLPDMESVMRSSFAAAERDEIAVLPSQGERRDAFYRCWTRKEAVLKALGWGLARALDSFQVSIGETEPRLVSMKGEDRVGERWQLLHVNPAPGFVGATAWVGPALTTQCFSYEP